VSNRHQRRRTEVLRQRGSTEEQIAEAPDRAETPERDPLLDAHATKEHLGNISEMTFWRWGRDLGFPEPDFVIGRRRFWRLSSIEAWLETQGARAPSDGAGAAPVQQVGATFPKTLGEKGGISDSPLSNG
jgi:predicted DNA-binding transcriptional regulator AlpA